MDQLAQQRTTVRMRQRPDPPTSELTTIAPPLEQGAIGFVLIPGQQEGWCIVGQRSRCDVAGDELSARTRRHHTEPRERARDVGAFDRNGSNEGPVLPCPRVVTAVD